MKAGQGSWAALAAVSLSVAAWGQKAPVAPEPAAPAGEPSELLSRALVDLDSPSVQTRIEATTRLLNSRSIDLRQIEAAIKSGKLSPEQRQRLLLVAQKRFCAEPRAAMGIGQDPNFTQRGVTLQNVQPDFPASEVLRPGDRIIAAGGQAVDIWETMRAIIVSRDPGDEIPVTLIRDGATLNVTVKLGEFSQLNARMRTARIDDTLLNEAWQFRSRTLQDPDAAPAKAIDSGLASSAWSQQVYIEDGEPGRGRSVDPDTSRTGLMIGGEARGGIAPAAMPQPRALNARLVPADPQLPGQPAVIDAEQLLQTRLQVARSIRDNLSMQIDMLRSNLAKANAPEAVRKNWRSQIDALNAEVQARDREIQQLQLQIKRP
jgi:hypothetical protein